MHISVRIDPMQPKEGAFVMSVRGYKGEAVGFSRRFDTMEGVWHAARKVGQEHCDWRTRESKGWGS